VSDKHNDYDKEKTEQKAADLVGKAYRCDTIDGININVCDDCPHFGKIRSPIELGLEVKEKEEEDTILEFEPPKLPFPFFRAAKGGIYKKGRDPDDEDVLVYHNDLFLTKRLNDREKGDMALAKLVLPKDGVREFLIPLSSMTSKEELRKILSSQGVVMMPKQLDLMMVYLIECTKNQQAKDEAEIMRTQFGWVDEDSKFILGDKEINRANVRYSPPSPKTESICKWLVSKGDIEDWKEVIRVYNKPDFEPHAFGFFTAFGAPLIKHLGFNGALINLINSSSGTGKSTVLKMCNSVYGHPDKLLAQETDTFAHKMHRLGVMNNLPYTVDEITNMHPESVSTLLYNVSQGSGPGRMQSQSNMERKNDTSWSLIALASSNASMAEKLSLIKQFADGEIMRLLEYRIDRTNNISKSDAYKLFEGGLLNNYGLAGPIYIEYLVKNLPKAVDLARDIQEHLDTKAGLNSRERFWSAVISCNIAGAQIAHHLRLIDLDIPRVLAWASNDLVDILRDQIVEPEIDFMGVLGGFLNANRGHILVVNGAQDARNSITPLPIVEPRYELTTRLEPDTEILYVFSKAIRNYCAREQIIFKDLVRDLKDKGIHQGTVRKRLAKGTTIDSPPVEAHIFKLEGTDLIDTEFMQNLGQTVDDPNTRDRV
jgi:energy-coupling factor transporter ATP-binding protein EcfA2